MYKLILKTPEGERIAITATDEETDRIFVSLPGTGYSLLSAYHEMIPFYTGAEILELLNKEKDLEH